MRALHRLYAWLFGYFWLPCPVCGKMYGGHEIVNVWTAALIKDGHAYCVCPNPQCSYEAAVLNAAHGHTQFVRANAQNSAGAVGDPLECVVGRQPSSIAYKLEREMKIVKRTVGDVVIEGRLIPRLSAHESDDGSVEIVLDGRFAATFPDLGIASQAAWLIANALAIGEGYSFLGASDKNHPFAPECLRIDAKPKLVPVPPNA